METERIKDRVVGVDISLNQTTLAVVDVRGNIIARTSFRTEEYPNISNYISNKSGKQVNGFWGIQALTAPIIL